MLFVTRFNSSGVNLPSDVICLYAEIKNPAVPHAGSNIVSSLVGLTTSTIKSIILRGVLNCPAFFAVAILFNRYSNASPSVSESSYFNSLISFKNKANVVGSRNGIIASLNIRRNNSGTVLAVCTFSSPVKYRFIRSWLPLVLTMVENAYGSKSPTKNVRLSDNSNPSKSISSINL